VEHLWFVGLAGTGCLLSLKNPMPRAGINVIVPEIAGFSPMASSIPECEAAPLLENVMV